MGGRTAFFSLATIAALILGGGLIVRAAGRPEAEVDGDAGAGVNWRIQAIMALNADQVVALWKTLPVPSLRELEGEYNGWVPDGGDTVVAAAIAETLFNESSALGSWLGKAYRRRDETAGDGYSQWRRADGSVVRNLRFRTALGASLIDGQRALLMIYRGYDNIAGSRDLVDEIRKLEDGLYLGLGTSRLEDGTRSRPAAFALTGPVDRWHGVDDESAEVK